MLSGGEGTKEQNVGHGDESDRAMSEKSGTARETDGRAGMGNPG